MTLVFVGLGSLQGIQDSTHCNPKSENAVKTKSNPVSTLQEPELSNQSPEIAIEPEFGKGK